MRHQSSKAGSYFPEFCFALIVWFSGAGVLRAQYTLEVQPGLTIPNSDVPWALEIYQSTPQLVPIHQAKSYVDTHILANSVPLNFKNHFTFELRGLHAETQLHSATPLIYTLVETDLDPKWKIKSSDSLTFAIVEAKPIKTSRVIDDLIATGLAPHATSKTPFIDVEITQRPDKWYCIKPKSPLKEGEYALLAIRKNGFPMKQVFDFRIDFSALNSKDAVVAGQSK